MRILVVKLSSLGDVVHALPVVADIRAARPEATIDWVVERLRAEAKFPGAKEIVTIDGVRVEYKDGFGLIRASNTTPVLVLRFEGHTPEALRRIEGDFMAALRLVKPDAQVVQAAH